MEQDGEGVRASVKWFDPAKGFGFVELGDRPGQAFLHVSVLNRAGLQDIGDGAELLCEIAPSARGHQVTRILAVRDPGRPRASRYPVPGLPGDHGAAEAELVGTVTWFKAEKGFGFAAVEDGGKDVFIHVTVLRRCGLPGIEAGARVRLGVRGGGKGREAVWVTLL